MRLPAQGYFAEKQKQFAQKVIDARAAAAKVQSALLRKNGLERLKQRGYERILFALYDRLDGGRGELEAMRDSHAPVLPDDDWDECFCYAIEKIPEVKAMRNDVWFAMANIGRPEFHNWL
jgi:hypothetical protein